MYVCMYETWLDNDEDDTVKLTGYNFVGRARTEGRGGGVGFLIKDNLNFQIYNPLKGKSESKTFESLFIRVKLRKTAPIFGIIYRPPGHGLKDFNDEFEELTACLKNNSTEIVLLGDFNIDLLKVNEHKDTNFFYNGLISNQYLPVITKPTRITSNSKTLIDNIFCTAWSILQYASIIISDLSDHLPIYAQFALEATIKQRTHIRESRPITETGLKQFEKALTDMNWEPVQSHCTTGRVNEAYDCFIAKYSGPIIMLFH